MSDVTSEPGGVEPGANGSEPDGPEFDGAEAVDAPAKPRRMPKDPKEPKAKKKGLAYRLYHGETSIDFIGRRNIGFIISAVVIGIGVISLATRGLNFGIDFTGGTSWEVPSKTLSASQVTDKLGGLGLTDTKVEVLSGSGSRIVRVQADVKGESAKAAEVKTNVRNELAKEAGVSPTDVKFDDVGPSWGKEISKKAVRALIFFFIAIAIYISLRFEWKMAVSALAAVVHDIIVTVGVYSLTGLPVTPGTVIAFLTILGYSLYDTIVVFDRVMENTRGLASSGRMTYGDMVNLSMNQTLMRSINTSLVALLPVLSVLVIGSKIMGATALEDFGFALAIGLITGAYSSIFIATPLLAALKEREPRYANIRARLANRGGVVGAPLTPAAAAAASGGVTVGVAADDAPMRPGGSASGGGGQPRPKPANRPAAKRPARRPRKKGRRR
jgi:preprotein translocase subunit SecF